MKIMLATPGRFHTMALARELQKSGSLFKIVSGFPAFSLKREGIEPALLVTAPFYRTLDFGLARLGIPAPSDELKFRSTRSVDRAANSVLRQAKEPPDVYMALSQTGTASGRTAKARGVTYVCDRGSTHIEEQQAILQEEHRLHGLAPPLIDPRSIERELIEYEQADLITVPSSFVQRSFVKRGIAADKVVIVPYGANLSMFSPTVAKPVGAFEVLFVGALSVRKGIGYLLEAFSRVQHPRKRLTLIGSRTENTERLLAAYPGESVRILGPIAQAQLAAHMSAAQVMVLASVEEGLALVMAEAMACGCPVIASKNTGAEDLFEDGRQGFIVEPRDVDALAERMQRLADDPPLAARMSLEARAKIEGVGGWADYARALLGHFAEARGARAARDTSAAADPATGGAAGAKERES
jgi:glycosyltransferase involved in cell wall biosynthesis